MRERTVIFGSSSRLVGILTDPATGDRSGPAFIFLNAGVVHRVGPSRLYVRLARALAGAGHLTLRFDLSGLGDSDTRSDRLGFIDSSVLEAREAMDELVRARSVTRCVLVGLCSGAALAFRAALADTRVVGVVLIDGDAYPTAGYHLRSYLTRSSRLFRGVVWRSTLRGENRPGRALYRLLGRTLPPAAAQAGAMYAIGQAETRPPRGQMAAMLTELMARGVRILCVYSGGQTALNYPGQIRAAFPHVPFGDRLTVSHFPEAAHTFLRQRHQERLAADLLTWARVSFGAVPGTE